MNVLKQALSNVSALIQNQEITIINKKQVNINGFSTTQNESISTYAHIQPLTPFEVAKITDSTLDSKSAYKFYILDNLAEVLNSLKNTKSTILWGDREFNVFSKNDYSLNGWVRVIGVEQNV